MPATPRTFKAGTTATCNRCHAKSPLPKDCQGRYENARAYRLDTLCTLPCGHLDTHFVYLSDLPGLPTPAVIAAGNDDLARLNAAVEALRLASGIVRAHNLGAPTASATEQATTIERFCDWWNFIALPVLTGEPAPDWAALRIGLIRQFAQEMTP